MDFNGLHSFAVMAYGESPYLEDCIESILRQSEKSTVYVTTSTPSEYIRNIALKYSIPLMINPVKPSLATDWQFAVNQCGTKLLTLAHQDDIYYSDYVKKLAEAVCENDASIAFCDYEEIVDKEKRRNTQFLNIKRGLLWPYFFKKSLKSRFGKRFILRFGNPICCPSVMFNLQKHKVAFNPDYKNDLDWDAWLNLCDLEGGFVYVKKILMAHRIHEESETTRLIADNTRYLEDQKIFRRLWPYPVAKILGLLYKRGYQSNSIKRGNQ